MFRHGARGLCSLIVTVCVAVPAGAQTSGARPGESIYLHGILPSGQPLTAERKPGLKITGVDAACSNCHRRSGLGEIEGNIRIPPISGPYLFRPRVADRAALDVPYVDGMRLDRDPYTDVSLARAIRDGIGVDGSPLVYLMPQYSLSDEDLKALIGYLKTMTSPKVRGVSSSAVNFATIVTPDADPVKRDAMLEVLHQYFADQNAFALAENPSMQRSQVMRSDAKRPWQLHVWTLSGPPTTWDVQLREYLAREPALAVISGLGGRNWGPVHRFCEQASLPCIFPNVELPVVAENDFYSLYFSRGVLLEADMLAHQIKATENSAAPRRVVQVFRADDVGENAAKALHDLLAPLGIQTVERRVPREGAVQHLAAAFQGVGPHDTVVLWLRPADIAALAKIPARVSTVLMSGLMGGLDQSPLPSDWRAVARMAYPFDLPEKRRVRVDYALGWFSLHHISVAARQVQADTYVACSLVMETLTRLSGSFVPDYLVERMEGMLEHQLVTGYYPRLALAPNERFASKGGYIVHFAGATGQRVLPDTEWLVP